MKAFSPHCGPGKFSLTGNQPLPTHSRAVSVAARNQRSKEKNLSYNVEMVAAYDTRGFQWHLWLKRPDPEPTFAEPPGNHVRSVQRRPCHLGRTPESSAKTSGYACFMTEAELER